MHKPFYASGFLFHVATEQILLQQHDSGDTTNLALFRGKSHKGDNPQTVFQHSVEQALGVSIPASSIRPVYDYIHDELGEHFIFYVEMTGTTPETYPSKNKTMWFSLAKLSKQAMSEQTRHDIIVGVRVIGSLLHPAHPSPNPKSANASSHSV